MSAGVLIADQHTQHRSERYQNLLLRFGKGFRAVQHAERTERDARKGHGKTCANASDGFAQDDGRCLGCRGFVPPGRAEGESRFKQGFAGAQAESLQGFRFGTDGVGNIDPLPRCIGQDQKGGLGACSL